METCKALASVGAKIILCSRSVQNGEKAVESEIKNDGLGKYKVADPKIIVKQFDLESLESVKRFADDVLSTETHIDGIILNAGIMALPNLEYTSTGLERQIGVNHFGHFYLVKLLEPLLLSQSTPCRIVSLSSIAHKYGDVIGSDLHYKKGRSYGKWEAYGQSKLANLLFAKSLADRYREKGKEISAVSVHPGVISTGLARHMGPVASFIYDTFFTDKTIPQGKRVFILAVFTREHLSSYSCLNNPSISFIFLFY